MADVTAQHPDYAANLALWKSVEDAAAGEAKVKAAKETYLPKPNPVDTSVENQKRYDQYLLRAVYYNATGRTLRTMVGMGFYREPEVEVPAGMAEAETDVTGSGLTLLQQAQAALGGVLKAGRCGLLVDFPKVEDPEKTSVKDQQEAGIRPTVTLYSALAITNWRTQRVGGKSVLSLVVLKESHEIPDGFGLKTEVQYRVLSLQGGAYQVEIWRKKETTGPNGLIEWYPAETRSPRNGAGQLLNHIPFQFVGSQNNDSNVDEAPLYDIATLNLAHYRNSADYEESVFFTGQPQMWMAGLTIEWRDWMQKTGIYAGSRAPLLLPENGAAGLLQAEPNTLAKEAMDGKEKQMAALGARLIVPSQQVKTATQQDSEDGVSHSVLSLACTNVASAYAQALEWFAAFANVSGKIVFTIHTDFSNRKLDPTELTALLQLVQSGQMPETDLWARLRAVGLIPASKTDDEIREELDQQVPRGAGNVDGGDNPEDDPPGGE